jgi:tripartite-type tricarboxylate transporter receptor subunit TctC
VRAFWRPVLAIGLVLLSAAAVAQPYPSRPIRIIVPYPPGGGTDVLTRIVGKYLGDSFKQPIVIENRAGANAQLGMDVVTKAPPDGYTLLAIAAGPLNSDNLNRFVPIALFAAPSYVLVLHPSVNANSVKELVALAKSQPGKLAYGSTGGGAASHLSAELFKAMTGTDMLHVPYKGIGNAVNDLLGGQVQLMIAPSQAVMQHVKAGKLKALAVSGTERSPSLPDLPTISEAGVPGYESAGWFGVVASAGTPEEIVTGLNRQINDILQSPDVKARLTELGAKPANLTPQQFLDFIRSDNDKWAKLIKERGIVIERQ